MLLRYSVQLLVCKGIAPVGHPVSSFIEPPHDTIITSTWITTKRLCRLQYGTVPVIVAFHGNGVGCVLLLHLHDPSLAKRMSLWDNKTMESCDCGSYHPMSLWCDIRSMSTSMSLCLYLISYHWYHHLSPAYTLPHNLIIVYVSVTNHEFTYNNI